MYSSASLQPVLGLASDLVAHNLGHHRVLSWRGGYNPSSIDSSQLQVPLYRLKPYVVC
jgi:hypothetical protein